MSVYSVILDLDNDNLLEYNDRSYCAQLYQMFLRNYSLIRQFSIKYDKKIDNMKYFKNVYIYKQIK